MIRLSICIATLNRAEFIIQTLNSILPQMTNEVELIVVDGASTDGTDRLVGELFSGRPDCHYHRLAEKGGVDLDYCRTVLRAVGEFCWLMTDDDLLKPWAVKRILKHLNDDLDLLLLNSEVANIDCSQILLDKRIQIESDKMFYPVDQPELLATAGDLISFIGSVVIRRATWLERDTQPYLGTEFVHVGVIFQSPLEKNTYILAEPLIRIRYGNAQWSQRAFEIWMLKWPRLIWSFPHLPDAAKSKVIDREPYRKLIYLVSMKARGCFGRREYLLFLSGKHLGWVNRISSICLAAFPEIPFNALASLIFIIFASQFGWNKMIGEELRASRYNYAKRDFLKAGKRQT